MENPINFILSNDNYFECIYLVRKRNENKKLYFIYFVILIPYVMLFGSLFFVNSVIYKISVILVYFICTTLLSVNSSNQKKNELKILKEMISDNEDINISIKISDLILEYEDQHKKIIINNDSIIEIVKFNKYLVIVFKRQGLIMIPINAFDSDLKVDQFISEIIGTRKIPIYTLT